MQEPGRVVAVSGARAEVDVEARGECEHCSAHGICNWTGNKLRRVLAVNEAGAAAGDTVMLETTEGTGAASNILVFGLPAALMLAGVLVGGLVLKKDLWSGILAGAGLAVGIVVLKLIDTSVSRSGRNLPVIVRKVDTSEFKGVECDKMGDSGTDSGGGSVGGG
jgi:positive regulator of sigma E activity